MNKNQYDFDQQMISQKIPIIHIPMVATQLKSSRVHKSNSKYYSRRGSQNVLADFQTFLIMEKQQQKSKLQQLKQRQQFIGQEIIKRKVSKDIKIQALEQEQKKKELVECTFQPKINRKGEKRNLNQFLQSQYIHSQKVLAKRQSLKKQTIETTKMEETFKPKINSTKKFNVPVFDRLYNKKQKQNSILSDRQYSFQPTITEKSKNLQRNIPIDQLLYSDAIRRQQKGRQIQSISTSYTIPKQINYRNQKYAAQKFIKQYFFALEELECKQKKLDYITFNQLLRRLGFVMGQEDSESTNANQERSLIHSAFQLLQQYEVNPRNICVFLLGLIGIYHINPINFEEQEQTNPQKQFNLEENQGRKLQKQFDLLYRNRLSSEAIRRNQEIGQIYSFQPVINKGSQAMAQRYRQQMLEQANQLLDKYPQIEFNIPENGIITHTDLLVLHRLVKDIQNQRKKRQIEDKNLQQCTFKPITISSTQTLNNSKNDSSFNLGSKKSIELYNYHKQLKSKKDSLKISREVQIIDSECTFAPKINYRAPKEGGNHAKQIDQAVYRLHKGRQEHQEKRNFLERGQMKKKKQKAGQMKRDVKNLDDTNGGPVTPSLIIDVNMGDKTQQILIYKGDQKRLPQLAKNFAIKHELDSQSQIKLVQLLKAEIQNVLQKIEEDQESSENDY